jgi:hypothetical protein
MPRTQNLNECVIYHIRHKETKTVIYVGSSCNFKTRSRRHKYNCNKEGTKHFNLPVYCYIRQSGGWDHYEVIPIELFKVENQVELMIKEREEMEKYDNLKNRYKSYINDDDLKTYDKDCYKRAMIKNLKRHIEYNEKRKKEINCPNCNKLICNLNVSRHKKTKKCMNYIKED